MSSEREGDGLPVLITGGAGFIGCNLANRLLSVGAVMAKPALRTMPSRHARLGIHQLVGSPAYSDSTKKHLGIARALEDGRLGERIVVRQRQRLGLAAQHALDDHQMTGHVLVDQIR